MPSDLVFKSANTFHRVLTKLSFGHLGWNLASMPVISLTTTGRKSGQKRTVLLTSPVRVGDSMLIVASKGGDAHHPAWFLNLEANPEVEVEEKGGSPTKMIARILDGDEREEFWTKAVAGYDGYADYQKKTDREIPLVMLDPAG